MGTKGSSQPDLRADSLDDGEVAGKGTSFHDRHSGLHWFFRHTSRPLDCGHDSVSARTPRGELSPFFLWFWNLVRLGAQGASDPGRGPKRPRKRRGFNAEVHSLRRHEPQGAQRPIGPAAGGYNFAAIFPEIRPDYSAIRRLSGNESFRSAQRRIAGRLSQPIQSLEFHNRVLQAEVPPCAPVDFKKTRERFLPPRVILL